MKTALLLVGLALLAACSRQEAEPEQPLDAGRQRTRDFWTTFRQANQLRVREEYEAAVKVYRRALELDAEHEESLYYLGASLEEIGQYRQAAEAYQRLVELNPASGRGLTQLAAVYSTWAPGAPTDPDRATGLLERAIANNREQAGPFLELGRLELDRGRLAAALEHFQIAARSGAAEGHYWSGYAWYLQGNSGAATREWRQVSDTWHREQAMAKAGVRAEGDVLPAPGKALSALERAGIKSRLWLRWVQSKPDAAGVAMIRRMERGGRGSVGDFDGDGRADLLVAGERVALLRNLGDRFADATAPAGLTAVRDVFDSAWADVDGDGRQDLYLVRGGYSGRGENALLHNRGGSFADITASSGLSGARATVRAFFMDFDGDRRPDLLEAGTPPRLFRNEGGKFRSVELPAIEGTPVDAAVADFNRDGRPDLVLLRWRQAPVVLLSEGGGGFTDVTGRSGLDGVRARGYSAVAMDQDNDGQVDLLISAHAAFDDVAWSLLAPGQRVAAATPRLFRNTGGGRFREVTAEVGLTGAYGTQQAVAADFDGDGWIDLLLANGSLDAQRIEPSVILRNEKGQRYREWLSLTPANHLGAALADFNGDGRLEIYLAPNPRIPRHVVGGIVKITR